MQEAAGFLRMQESIQFLQESIQFWQVRRTPSGSGPPECGRIDTARSDVDGTNRAAPQQGTASSKHGTPYAFGPMPCAERNSTAFLMRSDTGDALAARMERSRNMLNDRKKHRRAGAMASQHPHVVAMLRRTMMVMLPVWLVYFVAIKLFVTNLNAITVPYVDMPLGTYLVIQGSALAFTIILYLLARAFTVESRQ
jgi:putative solute:sodium symporter small subunit